MTDQQMPCVHTNGTGAKDLLEQYEHAGSALFGAMKALEAASPNGRDYYPYGSDALQKAQKEHTKRLETLREIAIEMENLAEYVSDFA